MFDANDDWLDAINDFWENYIIACMKDWGLDFVTVDHALMKLLEEDSDFFGVRTYYPSIDMMGRG